MKKIWEKPELIVLVKGTPEEFVLQACKWPTGPGNGPRGYDNDGCYYSSTACSSLTTS